MFEMGVSPSYAVRFGFRAVSEPGDRFGVFPEVLGLSSTDARSQILMAAGPIFAKVGYEKATVREICAAAGVNVAAVNYYFGDKGQLYVEAVRRAYELRSTQVPLPNWPADASAEEKLRGFVMTMSRRMVDDGPWETQLLFREVLHPTDACKTLVENHFRPQMELLMSILAELLPEQVPLSRRRKLAFSIVGQCMFYRIASGVVSLMVPDQELAEQFAVDQLGHHIADVILMSAKHCPENWMEASGPGQRSLVETVPQSNIDDQE